MSPKCVVCAIVMSAMALHSTGCGQRDEKGKVEGTVTVDGSPLTSGQIRFVPVSGSSTTAGAAITDGRFAAELPPGSMKVEISAPKVVGKQKMYDTPESPTVDVVEELLPQRYNVRSELTLEVKPGQQEASFPLTTK